MTYGTPQALRMALERRLLDRSRATGTGLDRLRRRVVFERAYARLQSAEPGAWVLKGGMALEVRLQDKARLTRDLDLGLRADVTDSPTLHDRLVESLTTDPDTDRFEFAVGPPERLMDDAGGRATWRTSATARLAGKEFGRIQLDISPRSYELETTDLITVPSALDFAGIGPTVFEIVDVNRHAAEKLHAMTRKFGDRENSRVRDLVDVVLLIEHGLIGPFRVAVEAKQVWAERDGTDPPHVLPDMPLAWPARYERQVADHEISARTYSAAQALVAEFWATMYETKEI